MAGPTFPLTSLGDFTRQNESLGSIYTLSWNIRAKILSWSSFACFTVGKVRRSPHNGRFMLCNVLDVKGFGFKVVHQAKPAVLIWARCVREIVNQRQQQLDKLNTGWVGCGGLQIESLTLWLLYFYVLLNSRLAAILLNGSGFLLRLVAKSTIISYEVTMRDMKLQLLFIQILLD